MSPRERELPKIVPPSLDGEGTFPPLAGDGVAAGQSYSKIAIRQVDVCGSRAADLRFEEVVFDACNLTQARFHGAHLHGADLRGSDLAELGVTACGLKGAIVEAGQLLQLAPLLGVVVR